MGKGRTREVVRRLAVKLGATPGEAGIVADGLRDAVAREIDEIRRLCRAEESE